MHMLLRRTVAVAGSIVTLSAHAQTCLDDVCFVDRGASGEINLGLITSGPCVLDYDNDGWPDLLLRNSAGQLALLFHNVPDPERSWP